MPQIGNLSDLLEPFKSDEESFVHTTIMLTGDRESQKLLSTWSMSPISWNMPPGNPPEDKRELWDWLWKGVRIDWEDFSARTGITSSRLQRLYEPLRANRLLYPDGTLPGHATALLRAEIKKSLPKKERSAREREDKE
jgi:hypothetical protein